MRELAAGTGAAVVFPDYDLSPEAKYPTAIEQIYAVAEWIRDSGADEGLDPGRVAVAGDSVGGNMATVTTLLSKQRNGLEFAGQLLSGMKGPVAVIPKALMRPVAAREVGEHLVRVAESGPVTRATDLVGPRNEVLADLARRQLSFDGSRRVVLEVRIPGAYGSGLASGALRGSEDALVASITFDEWLRGDHLGKPPLTSAA